MKNFQEASGISMQTAIFNEIGGNQITNHYTIREERDRNIYDEFRHIRLGDVEMIRELTLGKYNRGGLFTAMVHCGQGYKCTVLSYSGPNAKAEWERDFREVTGLRNPRTMQLFGINQSNVPLLIFHNELVPLGHVWNDLPILGQVYFATLAEFHFQCKRERLWIDPKRGSLIYGMWGPDSKYVGRLESDLPMSSNTDLLQEDVFWRYLSGIKPSDREYDNQITHELSEQYDWCQHIDRSTDLAGVNGVYSTLATSRIAVISTGWHYGCFDDTVLMPDGATRFTLHNLRDTGCFELKTDWWYNQRAWVSQAPAVFHELGVSLDKDLNNFVLSVPRLEVNKRMNQMIRIDGGQVFWQRRHKNGPIYLYIVPLLRSTCHRSRCCYKYRVFWSSDETGKRRLSNRTCRYLGIPTGLWVKVDSWCPWQYSWPTKVYKEMQRWQVSRGFDPTTTDFARYLGYPPFNIIQSATSRFEEVDKDSEDLSLDILFHNTQDATEESVLTHVHGSSMSTSTEREPLLLETKQPSPSIYSSWLIPHRHRTFLIQSLRLLGFSCSTDLDLGL